MSNNENIESTTIDPRETEMFTTLNSTWWDPSGPINLLHKLNNVAFQFMEKNLLEHSLIEKETAPLNFKDLKVLDVGCGGGIISEKFAKLGCNVIAIDINADLIAVAKEHAKEDPEITNLTYNLETVEEHALKNPEKYDVVINNLVLSHIREHEFFLDSCIKCLKPGGYIFSSALAQTYSALFMLKLYENVLRIMPKPSHFWDNLITREKTQEILEKFKCKTEDSQGFFYNILLGRTSAIKRTSLFYILFSVKSK